MDFQTRFLAKLAENEPTDRERLEEALAGLSPEQIDHIMRPDYDMRQTEQVYEKLAQLGPMQRAFLILEQFELEKQAMTVAGTALKGLTAAKPMLQRGLNTMANNPQAALMAAGGLAGATYGGLKSQPIDPTTGQRRSRLSGAVRGGLAGVGVGALAGQSKAVTQAVSNPERIAKLQAGLGTKGVAGTWEQGLAKREAAALEQQAARKAQQEAAAAAQPVAGGGGGGGPSGTTAPAPQTAPPVAAPPAAAPPAGGPAPAGAAPSPMRQAQSRIQSTMPDQAAAEAARAGAAAPAPAAAGPGMAATPAPQAAPPMPPPPPAAAAGVTPRPAPGPTTDVAGRMPPAGAGEQVFPRPVEAAQARIQAPAPDPAAAAAARGAPANVPSEFFNPANPGPAVPTAAAPAAAPAARPAATPPEYASYELGGGKPVPDSSRVAQIRAEAERINEAPGSDALSQFRTPDIDPTSALGQKYYALQKQQVAQQTAAAAAARKGGINTAGYLGKKKVAAILARYGLQKRASTRLERMIKKALFENMAKQPVEEPQPAKPMFGAQKPVAQPPLPLRHQPPSWQPGTTLTTESPMFGGQVATGGFSRARDASVQAGHARVLESLRTQPQAPRGVSGMIPLDEIRAAATKAPIARGARRAAQVVLHR